MIDGGKGQLSSGLEALEEFRAQGVPVISLAKRLEEVYLPDRSEPLVLPRSSPALQLLQRIRDEAHRFAIEHHRVRRDRSMRRSILDDLPASAPPASARCYATSARRSGSWARRARNSRRSRDCRGRWPARFTSS